MTLQVGADVVDLRLSGWDQAFHTPALALATMLHRNVVIAHGTADAWVDPGESRLLVDVLRDAGNDPERHELPGADHDLGGADDGAIDALAGSLVRRMESRELPPVLVAIEEMGRS